MATNFTNKYMQVFQNYNEFGEHSADYVRGEDHIAFLIEENEVIYWLYLEQVWRPLNVRTTTTGELEDGRTKVAVRLEYIEGGQKYTSVPNIPDPERITSMSRFLEDYPDIEEVNVSGTVNLTDLSYAFAGSKIKDFSMLDTSNVTKYNNCLENVTLTNDIIINVGNVEEVRLSELLKNSTITNARINIPNSTIIIGSTPLCDTTFDTFEIPYNEEDIEINESDTDLNWGDGINKYKTVLIRSSKGNKIKAPSLFLYFNDVGESYNIDVQEIECINALFDAAQDVKNIKIKAKKLICEFDGSESLEGKIDNREVECTCITKDNWNYIPTISFGYGFYKNPDRLTGIINNNGTLGNFFYTIPIVDDTFYSDKQCPISIFQYKTTFEEVADVNISSKVDSSLIYVDWYNIDFDTSNMSMVINNYMPNDGGGISIQETFFILNGKTFNKFILDNNITDENNLPTLCFQNVFFELNTTEFSYIRGKYKLTSLSGYATYRHTSMFNNLVLYSDIEVDIKSLNTHPFLTKDNVIIKAPRFIITNVGNSGKIEITNLINDNNELYISYYNSYPNYLIRDTSCVLYVSGLLCSFYDWFAGTAVNVPIHIDGETNFYLYITYSNDDYISYYKEKSIIDNLFIECKDNCFIGRIDILEYDTDENIINHGCVVKNIYGIVNVTLPYYVNVYNASNIIYNEDTFESIHHIDINSSRCIESNSFITSFKNLDNETLINLITKLIDNTSSSIKTIYMYRSQHTIIGEENITAAVAKNYEFAIIEN